MITGRADDFKEVVVVVDEFSASAARPSPPPPAVQTISVVQGPKNADNARPGIGFCPLPPRTSALPFVLIFFFFFARPILHATLDTRYLYDIRVRSHDAGRCWRFFDVRPFASGRRHRHCRRRDKSVAAPNRITGRRVLSTPRGRRRFPSSVHKDTRRHRATTHRKGRSGTVKRFDVAAARPQSATGKAVAPT